MPVIVFAVVALMFQRIERFICNLPSGSAASHEVIDVTLAHPDGRHPTKVLDAVSPTFPVLDEMDLHVRVRCIERPVIDEANPMHNPRGAVMPLVRGDTPSVLRCLHLREPSGMIAFFAPQNIVQTVRVQGLEVRGLGTQAIFGPHELERWMVLAELHEDRKSTRLN